jgi:hypothetical protein
MDVTGCHFCGLSNGQHAAGCAELWLVSDLVYSPKGDAMPHVDGDDYTYERQAHLNTLIAPYLHRDDARDLRTVDQRTADELAALCKRVAFLERVVVLLGMTPQTVEDEWPTQLI